MKKFVRVIEDIEEALSREVRHIVFFQHRYRGSDAVAFKEMFDVFTGEFKVKPIEPRFYDDGADSLVSSSPRFTLRLLKLFEDINTKRLMPPYGEEIVEQLPSPGAYQVKLGGETLITTNGAGSNSVQLTHRKIKEAQPNDWLRIITGTNIGTYIIDSIDLIGNGPHTINLSHILLNDLPTFNYNKDAGVITFDTFIDLTVVKPGDQFVDNNAHSFTIAAVNVSDSTIAIPKGSAVAVGFHATIRRNGLILQNDDLGEEQCFQILDPSEPIEDKDTRYLKKSQLIPYTFIYYIKIVSRERDDHIAIADRMMQVFNPPRGMLSTIVRSQKSMDSPLVKDVNVGDKVIFLQDASNYYPNDNIRILDNLSYGEEAQIQSVNTLSNSVTLKTPIAAKYTILNEGLMSSNSEYWAFERDFMNHQTEDKEDMQLWIHRFTYRVEGWVESRIALLETSVDETTEEEVGDVNFVKVTLENLEGHVFDTNLTSEQE